MFKTSNLESFAVIEFCYGKVNAMDLEFCSAVVDKLRRLVHEENAGVILRGNGHVFSAGIDLKRWLTEGPEYVEPFLKSLEQLFETVFCYRKPIISQINGHAIAGGCMIAAACDYRVIVDEAKMGVLDSRLGVPLPMTAVEIIRFVAAPSVFRKIVTVGADYTGKQAVAAGLADAVATGDELDAMTLQAAEALAAIPLPAFRLSKQQMRDPVMRIVKQHHELFFESYLNIWQSAETRLAIKNYAEKRLNFKLP